MVVNWCNFWQWYEYMPLCTCKKAQHWPGVRGEHRLHIIISQILYSGMDRDINYRNDYVCLWSYLWIILYCVLLTDIAPTWTFVLSSWTDRHKHILGMSFLKQTNIRTNKSAIYGMISGKLPEHSRMMRRTVCFGGFLLKSKAERKRVC